MVDIEVVYYGVWFKGQSVITKGRFLPTTIFNMVVDAVVRHWFLAIVEAEGKIGSEGFGRDVQRLAAYFHANNGPLVPKRAARLQNYLHVLTELFDRVGIRTNLGNMVRWHVNPVISW